jgi:hypothetical protein
MKSGRTLTRIVNRILNGNVRGLGGADGDEDRRTDVAEEGGRGSDVSAGGEHVVHDDALGEVLGGDDVCCGWNAGAKVLKSRSAREQVADKDKR